MTTAIDNTTWTAPGPGLWERDAAHQDRPFCALWLEAGVDALSSGTGEACARFGLPVGGLEVVAIRGWFFGTMTPVPEEVFLERIEAAEVALATRAWRAAADEWVGSLRGAFIARNNALLAVSPDELDDAALAGHIEEALANFSATARRHFYQSVAHWVGVGLLILEAEALAGWAPERTIRALTGASPASTAPVAGLQQLASAISADPQARELLSRGDDPGAALAALRNRSSEIREAFDGYLALAGWNVFTGFDFTHEAIIEMPDLLLTTIRHAMTPRGPAPASGMDELRESVPPEARERVSMLIEDAVAAYGLRDDDSPITVHTPTGIVRRALLVAGARLESRGSIRTADDIFDAVSAEIRPLLIGGTGAPDAGELARRAALRREADSVPPRRLGEDEPPPDGELPAAMGLITGAVFAAMALEENAEEPAANAGQVTGVAASPGVYEGTARIILGEGDFERLEPGDVLVTTVTTPSYNVVLPLLGAVVTDRGGILSHPAIVAREFGIPAVVGTNDATARITDGASIRVDGGSGTVTIL